MYWEYRVVEREKEPTYANYKISGSLGDVIANNISLSTLKIADIIRLGTIEVKSVASYNNDLYLSFPLPETVLCDCTLGNMNLYMPNVVDISTTATCKLYIRRINSNSTVINFYPFLIYDYVFYNQSNQLVNSITNIGWVNMWLILYNRKWYFSEHP